MCNSASMKWTICLVVLLCSQLRTMAQDSLSVEEAIATALNNNYDILLSRQDSASVAISNEYRNFEFCKVLQGFTK